MVVRSKFDCDGVKLAVHGEFTDDTMVFQHGLCDTAEYPIEAFPQDTATSVVAMEFRGHGDSEAGPADDFSIRQFTDDVIALIEAKASRPVVIGGISMGSAVALRVAVQRPELIRALVVGRPAWLMSQAPSNLLPLLLIGRSLRQDPHTALSKFQKSELYSMLSEHFSHNLSALLELFDRQPLDITAELLARISMDGPSLSVNDVASINVPTLVVGTDNDIIHPLDYASSLSKMIPNAELAVITSKFDDVDQYRVDFQSVLSSFLRRF
ncbi:hypothetical protein RA28_00700 [Ruegeria sp. ANG-S4]|uniref:alpha/beta fold hydrolase n=1 Tax=Ruegeria sp. ANG-S4 TaxID=1577904 RepID=UPI00057DFB81|nr:alpha/beta hydrolase [Ruegeria sp. ANG-S4]KIC46362.1 hypothetical protein RA28_00700 [Ruegeria sp. ANG-S4]